MYKKEKHLKHEQLRGEKRARRKEREKEEGKERRKWKRVTAIRNRMTGENGDFFFFFIYSLLN